MADDWHCKQLPNGNHPIVLCEREALWAEIERLRAAGDALALSIETFVPGVLAHISIKQAFSDWQEARRG